MLTNNCLCGTGRGSDRTSKSSIAIIDRMLRTREEKKCDRNYLARLLKGDRLLKPKHFSNQWQ
ncbi:hypothetical protein QUB51_22930 [Microcoleus sp. AT8-A3]|uniref:hypothetical protein n=1 Tax=Microcoleus sp. AT8-B2 TaxID=2818618 RepID=UPI002FD36C92